LPESDTEQHKGEESSEETGRIHLKGNLLVDAVNVNVDAAIGIDQGGIYFVYIAVEIYKFGAVEKPGWVC
jgi:hypothetical protein